ELLQAILDSQMGAGVPATLGKRLIIHPYGDEPPAQNTARISRKEFDKIALALSIEFNDEASGSILCQVTGERTGEVLRLLFEKKYAVAFWAHWV
ncbi:MAG: hypothetical protein ACOYM2_14105, partial [Rectinemataceae bacterium]